MIKRKILLITMVCFFLVINMVSAQEAGQVTAEEQAATEAAPAPEAEAPSPEAEAKPEEQKAIIETLVDSQNVTLDFKDADIRNVLKIISYKSGVNIVSTPEVMGNISIRLVDVPWDKALDVILKTYGFAYDRQGNIISVAPIEKLTAQKQQEAQLAQVQPTATEVFQLKYIDAQDAKKALEPQLSARGKITVLEMSGQAGWEFGGTELGKRKRLGEEKAVRSKILIVSDIPPTLEKIKEVVKLIDAMPKQILIETRIMEVNRDKLKDLGLEWGTGSSGVSGGYATAPTNIGLDSNNEKSIAGRNIASDFTPGIFSPKEGTSTLPGTYPYKAGLEVLFKKLTGAQFEVLLHALEEDANTNTLSAPRIMALNNQEATILVGTRYPILKTEISGTESTTTTVTLDYYQDIGIQLNVVPQIAGENYINMVIHPAVTDYTTTLGTNAYPIILTREAETRIVMRDGETVVIGGLLKDVKSKENIGIPFLSKIPILGPLFGRETIDTQKIDLLIFITANIVKEDTFTPEEIAKLEERLGRGPEQEKATLNKKKKK
jgi:type IV pilus assembly protein PilQ